MRQRDGVDVKLSGVVDTTEGQDAIQRGPGLAQKAGAWDSCGLTRSSIRCCTWLRANPGFNTGWRTNGLKAALPKKKLGGTGRCIVGHDSAMYTCSPES